MIDLNPDGPHSPARTAEAGQLFDDCSRFLVYASMSGKGGLEYPGDAYRLIADIYAATGRLSQACDQISRFLQAQAARPGAYEGRGRNPQAQATLAAERLVAASSAAHALTEALRGAQTAIAGLGIRDDERGDGRRGDRRGRR